MAFTNFSLFCLDLCLFLTSLTLKEFNMPLYVGIWFLSSFVIMV